MFLYILRKSLCLGKFKYWFSLSVYIGLVSNLHAQINPSKQDIELSVVTNVNKEVVGNLTLIVSPEDSLSLKWEEIAESLNELLIKDVYDAIATHVDSNGVIKVSTLKQKRIAARFSLMDFSLTITIPLELTKEKKLSATSDRTKQKTVQTADISGFTNLYSSYLYQINKAQESSQYQLTLRPEFVLNFSGWVLENEAEYITSNNKNEFKRLGTRIIHDLPLDGMRFSVGDNYSSGSYFQSTTRMIGVSIAHDFTLVSDRLIRPSASQSFTLESPSSVEVFVEERLVQRLNLAAGVYSLNDIPLREGNNNIVLRITDNAGITKIVDFSVTTGLDLFAQGQLEYEIHIGYPAELKSQLDYNNDVPLISSYFDYGITPSWTVGFSLQGNEYRQQVGLKQVVATPIGQIAFENAINLQRSNGYAYRFVYSSYNDPLTSSSDFSIGYEYSNQDFYKLNFNDFQKTTFQQREHFIQGKVNFVNSSYTQTSLYGTLSRKHDQESFDKSVGLGVSGYIFSNSWRYSLSGQWEDLNNEKQWGWRANLSFEFSSSRRVKASHLSNRNKTRLEYTQDESQRYVGALNIRTGIEKNERNEAVFDLNTQYSANRYLLSFDHATYYEQLNAKNAVHQSRLNWATSVAFADSQWGVGKPVQDSFALVRGHESLAGKVISLGLDGEQYRANNSDFGTILLSDINSYDNATVNLDVADLSPGYDIGAGLIAFYPSYKSGHFVTVGTDANISVIASLKYSNNNPLSLQVGTARCMSSGDQKSYTFFTNKSGRFALTGLKPCKYQIVLKGIAHESIIVDVTQNEQLQRKGVIYVQ
ncbi:fimbria/pilus outer membrane usher protein [Pseudoalteromonas gelatinilytica]